MMAENKKFRWLGRAARKTRTTVADWRRSWVQWGHNHNAKKGVSDWGHEGDSVKEWVHMTLNDAWTTTVVFCNVVVMSFLRWLSLTRRCIVHSKTIFVKSSSFANIIITKMSPVQYTMMVSLDRHFKCVVNTSFSSSVYIENYVYGS